MKQTNTGQWCDKIPEITTRIYDVSFDVINDNWRSNIYTSKTAIIAISDCWIGDEKDLW